jgi:hypothetical protein
MDTSGRIPRAVLGIAGDATLDDARKAFRLLVKCAHPDVGGDPAVFVAVVDAFKAVTSAQDFVPNAPLAISPRRRSPTPYDWAVGPTAPVAHIWAERAPARRPAPRTTACFADILDHEMARLSHAA